MATSMTKSRRRQFGVVLHQEFSDLLNRAEVVEVNFAE